MSISEVAERAGVSRTTVSLVINNRSSISSATAGAVRRAMDELGYRPAAPEHRPGRKAKLSSPQGVRLALIANMPGAFLRSPVYSDLLHGVETAARQAKASILLHTVPPGETLNAAELVGTVDGLVLFGGQPTAEGLGSLGSLPCVQVMRSPIAVDWCDHVTYKSESIGYLAANYLLREGHLHTACLSQGTGVPWSLRQLAFEATVREAGGTTLLLDGSGVVEICGHEQTPNRELLGSLVDQLLGAKPRPTALFLSSDILAAPTYWSLLERGIQPGRDLQIVSCNNERPLLNGLHPRPAVIDIQSQEVGRQAVERLLWRLKNTCAPVADILIQPVLVEPS